MRIDTFNRLAMPQQHYYTMKCGVFIGARYEKAFAAYLFQLGEFYAELVYEHGGIECSLITAFHSTTRLEPYLSMIDLNVLLSGD